MFETLMKAKNRKRLAWIYDALLVIISSTYNFFKSLPTYVPTLRAKMIIYARLGYIVSCDVNVFGAVTSSSKQTFC